ncbi:hypothetical protein HOD29_00225 [archaeon]|jgi:hypothetical protein|nr:hypothetical protein [archaeon]
MTRKIKDSNLEKDVKAVHTLFFRRGDSLFYQEDSVFFEKPIEEIKDYLSMLQDKPSDGGSYKKLLGISEKNGNVVYSFQNIPGFDSVAVKRNHPVSYVNYKIKSKLKLVDKE